MVRSSHYDELLIIIRIKRYNNRNTTILHKEVKNRTEQVGRLNEQLLNQEKAYNERLTALKLDAKSVEKLEQSYLGQIAVLTTRLDDEAKAKGRALLRVAVLEAENKDLKDRLTAPLSIRYLIRVIIKKLFKKG